MQKKEVLGKRETLLVLFVNYLQGLVVLGTGVEVRSTRAITIENKTQLIAQPPPLSE